MPKDDETRTAFSKQWSRLVTAVAASISVVAALPAPVSAATTTFTADFGVTIPAMGNAAPYPSSITASGLTGNVTDVEVTFPDFSHDRPTDLGIVLVAPGGEALALMDCVTDNAASNLFVTLSDGGSAAVPGIGAPLGHGVWRPANYCTTTTSYPDPGPGTTYSSPPSVGTGTLASTFGGTDPNGAWNLFIRDFVAGNDGAILPWSLAITTPDPAEPPEPPAPPAADTSAPDTTITRGPKDKTKQKSSTFEFTSSELGSTFECAVDDQSLKAPCTSPFTVKAKKGKHTFRVQATDQAGNVDATPASDAWKVKKKK
jgi:subtilisin-like proprotein convertase family protein